MFCTFCFGDYITKRSGELYDYTDEVEAHSRGDLFGSYYPMDNIFYGNLPREDRHLTQEKVDQINIFNNRNPNNNKYKNEIYRFSPK